MTAPQVNTAPRGRKTVGKQPQAPQVNILCTTGGKCLIVLGGIMQAHPQEPPEVYSNLLPPSVGDTTGGIHPKAPQVNVQPPEVNTYK